jgi:DNA polymerase III delta prime subunit
MQQTTFISKYKPYYINDFCADDKFKMVVKTLFDLEDLNILFVGEPGCGKTTLLYAIIREYYGLSKTQMIPETNILLINNLKEHGINYYRNDMKTFCQSHCSIYGKKKMVIIDDIDMINQQSQQVFRNYIDKYKHNVHFISVCTNIQKVIESLQSRVHILHVNFPPKEDIEVIMNRIIDNEDLEISNESRQYMLRFSNYSIRNIINLLEKIRILGISVDIELCRRICSDLSFNQFEQYIHHLRCRELNDAIRVFYFIHDYGYSVIDIFDYFFTFVKKTDLLTEDEKYKIIPFLCKYITIFNNIHEDIIELSLFTNELYNSIFN